MQYTENYSLKLPGYGDNADVGDLNDNTTAIDALIHANRQIEAPAFSTTTAYTAGEMCVYENVLYKFTADKAAGNWDSTKVTATNLADEVTDAAQSGGTEVEANPVEAATADLHKLKVENTVYGIPDPTVTKTATGNPIEFSDGADAPLVKCVTQITGYQSGTGTPSPDNIRPIVAYTEGEIEVCGKNLFNLADASTGYIDENGEFVSYDGFRASAYMMIVEGETYTLSYNRVTVGVSRVGMRIVWYDDKYNFIQRDGIADEGTDIGIKSASATAPSNAKYAKVSFPYNRQSTQIAENIQFEAGTTATTYEPYTSTTHNTTYPSAIYRGSEDVANGSLGYDMQMIDLGNLNWTKSGVRFYAQWASDSPNCPYAPSSDATYIANAVCDSYYVTSRSQIERFDGAFSIHNASSVYLTVNDSRYATAEDFKAGVTGVKLAYQLLTPTTTSVTPTNLPIKSLSGFNHIESSTGEMEVEYITQGYQPLVDLIDEAADTKHAYSATEHVVGKWVDGETDVLEKEIITEFNNAAPQYTLDLSSIGGVSTMPIFVSHSVLDAMEGSTPIKQITMPAATNSTYSSISVQHQSSAVTGKAYITVRYIKTSSNNRSLSKGSTEGLRAEISEEKKEIEESPETEEKTVKEAQSEGEENKEEADETEGNADEGKTENEEK